MAISAEARKKAKEQAATDKALLAALAERKAAGEEPTLSEAKPEEPETQTLGDQYMGIAQLIAKAKRETRLSETSLIKLWELNLQWVLNERHLAQQAAQQQRMPWDIPTQEVGSEGTEDSGPPPTNEVITEVEETPKETD